jgi:transposase
MNFLSSDDRRSAFVGLGLRAAERLLLEACGTKAGAIGSLAQTRDRLAKQRIALKNRANNILGACGLYRIEEALSSDEKLRQVLELVNDEVVRMQLRVIVEQIRTLNRSIAELERIIQRPHAPRSPRRRVSRR